MMRRFTHQCRVWRQGPPRLPRPRLAEPNDQASTAPSFFGGFLRTIAQTMEDLVADHHEQWRRATLDARIRGIVAEELARVGDKSPRRGEEQLTIQGDEPPAGAALSWAQAMERLVAEHEQRYQTRAAP